MGKRRRAALLVLAALAACLLGGCARSYAGNWSCACLELAGGDVMTAGDLQSAGSEMHFKLRVDGSGVFTADGESQRIRWYAQSDDVLVFVVGGANEIFRVQDGALVWEMERATVHFLRTDSAAYTQALSTSAPESRSAAG